MLKFGVDDSDGEDSGTGGKDDGLGEDFKAALERRLGGGDVAPAPAEPQTSDDNLNQDAEGGDGSSPLPSPPEVNDGEDGDVEPALVFGDDETEPPTATTQQAAPDPNDFDLNDLFTQWNGGTKPDRHQITNLLRFVQDVAALDPTQQQLLNQVLSGQSIEPAAPTPPAAQPSNISQLPDDLPDETRALLEPLLQNQQSLEQRLLQYETHNQQAQLQARQATIESGVNRASEKFITDYSGVLTTNDLILLESSVMQGGQFPAFLAQNNNDPEKAYRALLEATVFSNEALRSKFIAAQTAKTTPTPAEQTRVRKASAVAAGGSITPISAASSAPKSKTFDRKSAVEYIKELGLIN